MLRGVAGCQCLAAPFTLTLAAACDAPDGAIDRQRRDGGIEQPQPESDAAHDGDGERAHLESAAGDDGPIRRSTRSSGRRREQMVTETLTYTATATCGTSLLPTIAVTATNPAPSRRPTPDADWIVLDPHHVQLRAVNDPFRRTGRDRPPAAGRGSTPSP